MKSCNALIINATAGSGKTTTIRDGVTAACNDSFRPDYPVSSEQLAIWDWLNTRMDDLSEIIFVAFSRSVADKLHKEITHGTASTVHSLGYRVLRNAGVKCKSPSTWKTSNLFCEYMQVESLKVADQVTRDIYDEVKELVKMCKDALLIEDTIDEDSLQMMCMARNYNTTTAYEVLTPAVKYVIEKGSQVKTGIMSKPMEIDYDDMIYLPARYGYKSQFDVMLIDEAQDLSPGKLQLLLNQDCETYVFVGDPNQAIFGFAGADTHSFESIKSAIESVDELSLSYTFRCGKAIVEEAKKLVGDAINAGPNNPDGLVRTIMQDEMDLAEGDMLVSRVNAPLMAIAWSLVRERKNVKVIGRDIGAGLAKLIKRLVGKGDKAITGWSELVPRVEAWLQKELATLQNKKMDTDSQQMALSDQADCIIVLAGQCGSVEEMLAFIKDLFVDDGNDKCIRLSSIHRAKGLEANRVFFFNPANVPHPMAKSPEAKAQEHNLKFVATTRAIHELVYVTTIKKEKPVRRKVGQAKVKQTKAAVAN